MITTTQVIEWSKKHPCGDNARHTRIRNNKVEVSIVGGGKGLYGDFEEDFEIAVIDLQTKKFVTKFFKPNLNDDVIGYVNRTEMEELLNSIFKDNSFQVL